MIHLQLDVLKGTETFWKFPSSPSLKAIKNNLKNVNIFLQHEHMFRLQSQENLDFQRINPIEIISKKAHLSDADFDLTVTHLIDSWKDMINLDRPGKRLQMPHFISAEVFARSSLPKLDYSMELEKLITWILVKFVSY